jgi:hypothetical protein
MTRTNRMTALVALLAAVLAASLLLALALPQVAFSKEKKSSKQDLPDEQSATLSALQAITSGGPLTKIVTSDTLNCQVYHQNDGEVGEFYHPDDDEGDCGTFLAVGGTTYGPSVVQAGDQAVDVPFTSVNQSSVTGSGTQADPYKVVTVVDAGTTGLRVTQTDSYVAGQENYQTDVTVKNNGSSSQNAILYRAGDCYLQNLDFGLGSADSTTGVVRCVIGVEDLESGQTVPGERIMEWKPLTSGSSYYEARYSQVWDKIGAGQPFGNTCARCSEYIDNGAGLSWNITIPAGGEVTHSHLTTIDTGEAPTVENVTPSNGATKVLRNTNVTATFSEAMRDDETLTVALVKTGTTTPEDGTVELSEDGKTVTFDPYGPSPSTQKLKKKTTYTVTVKGKDLAGNPVEKVWSFKTGKK